MAEQRTKEVLMKLAGMSPSELRALIQSAQTALIASRKDRIAEAKTKITAILADSELALGDVFPAHAKTHNKRPGAGIPKYANPKNPTQTWTGFGKKPAWFLEALKGRGVTEATLRVGAQPQAKAVATAVVAARPGQTKAKPKTKPKKAAAKKPA